MSTWYQQYVAVKEDLRERYPQAEWVSVTRDAFNRMSAHVQGPDMHAFVFYWFKGGTITDSWVTPLGKKCTEECLHSHHPQEDPHRIEPESWWDHRTKSI